MHSFCSSTLDVPLLQRRSCIICAADLFCILWACKMSSSATSMFKYVTISVTIFLKFRFSVTGIPAMHFRLLRRCWVNSFRSDSRVFMRTWWSFSVKVASFKVTRSSSFSLRWAWLLFYRCHQLFLSIFYRFFICFFLSWVFPDFGVY